MTVSITSASEVRSLLYSPVLHSTRSLQSTPLLSGMNGSADIINTELQFTVYTKRWLILFIFSLLALLNNVVCYTFASVHHLAREHYATGSSMHLSDLVSIFFITYVVFSFPSSWIVEKYGLRSGVLLGSYLQAIGCGIRSMSTGPSTFNYLFYGQIIAGLGQSFFVNTPPMLGAAWFSSSERTLATTIAVNANTVGIAGAFLLGPYMVTVSDDMELYVRVIFYASTIAAVLATLFFTSGPITPPSVSQRSKVQSQSQLQTNGINGTGDDDNNIPIIGHSNHLDISIRSLINLFHSSGFIHTVLAFSISEATINGFSGFFNSILIPLGYDNIFIGYLAVSFISMCMIGSAVIGIIVDRTHSYKLWIILCFIGSSTSIIGFIYSNSIITVTLTIAAAGFFIGPIQPLSIESGVECTYPSSASTVAAVLQVIGNIASAALFPIMLALRDNITGSMINAIWAIAVGLASSAVIYSTFNGRYYRIEHEEKEHREHSLLYGNGNNNNTECEHRHHHHRSHSNSQNNNNQSNISITVNGTKINGNSTNGNGNGKHNHSYGAI